MHGDLYILMNQIIKNILKNIFTKRFFFKKYLITFYI